MKSLVGVLLTAVLLLAAWGVYSKLRAHAPPPSSSAAAERPSPAPATPGADPGAFRCDARKYCSQMTSCAEAKFFLAHCPDVRLDKNHNGVPCEAQWCPGG